jgi:DNA-binding MarR family transcriptional regulator
MSDPDVILLPPKKRIARGEGATLREFQVLRTIQYYGWLSVPMLREIAVRQNLAWQDRRFAYDLVDRLLKKTLIFGRMDQEGGSARSYALTPKGLSMLKQSAEDLLECDANVVKDTAGIAHYLGLAKIMLQFRRHFPINYWLTDLQVRSENNLYGRDGLAKDYDAVTEVVLPERIIAIGIELEHSRQRNEWYAKLSASLNAERYLHAIVYFLDRHAAVEAVPERLKPAAGRVCFASYRQFLLQGFHTTTCYWRGDELVRAPLGTVLTVIRDPGAGRYAPFRSYGL